MQEVVMQGDIGEFAAAGGLVEEVLSEAVVEDNMDKC